MKKRAIAVMGVMVSSLFLSGCVIAPAKEGHRHHHADKMITRDGVSLPDCETLPDASQADNGSRCWYR